MKNHILSECKNENSRLSIFICSKKRTHIMHKNEENSFYS